MTEIQRRKYKKHEVQPVINYSIIMIITIIYEKCANLFNSYIFVPIAFENVGTLNSSAVALISAFRRKISTKSNDLRESTFLFRRLAIILQRFNSVFCERVLCVIRTSDHLSCF